MRQESALRVLRLAIAMRGAALGVSLEEIREMFGVSERTAHRLRDAVVELFPETTVADGPDRRRRWRLPRGTADRLVGFNAEEVAALGTAPDLLAAHGFADLARRLEAIDEKVRSLLPADHARRLEPDVEALIEAEGVALRPGPRPRTDPEVLDTLRTAIKGCEVLALRYRYRSNDRAADVELEPYGILLGSRHYLLGHRPGVSEPPFLRLYSLPEIERVARTGRMFARDPAVSVRAFAERAFGVFQEEPRRILWRFSGRAVRDAAAHRFHPSQRTRMLPDGRLEVEFFAGGLLEMCWHLFTWGRFVEIVEPAELRVLYSRCLEAGGWPFEEDDPRQLRLFGRDI